MLLVYQVNYFKSDEFNTIFDEFLQVQKNKIKMNLNNLVGDSNIRPLTFKLYE